MRHHTVFGLVRIRRIAGGDVHEIDGGILQDIDLAVICSAGAAPHRTRHVEHQRNLGVRGHLLRRAGCRCRKLADTDEIEEDRLHRHRHVDLNVTRTVRLGEVDVVLIDVIAHSRPPEIVHHHFVGVEFLINAGGGEDRPVKRGLKLRPVRLVAHEVHPQATRCQHQDKDHQSKDDQRSVFRAQKPVTTKRPAAPPQCLVLLTKPNHDDPFPTKRSPRIEAWPPYIDPSFT